MVSAGYLQFWIFLDILFIYPCISYSCCFVAMLFFLMDTFILCAELLLAAGTCTNIMHLTTKKKLEVYKGNYSSYVKTKAENEVQQLKQYEAQQDEIQHIKRFIASCGTFANAVKQAQSRQKVCISRVTIYLTKVILTCFWQ